MLTSELVDSDELVDVEEPELETIDEDVDTEDTMAEEETELEAAEEEVVASLAD